MKKVLTLEDALKRIEELERENAVLKEELEYYKNRKMSEQFIDIKLTMTR